jgi:ribose transport system ATP-binding protein
VSLWSAGVPALAEGTLAVMGPEARVRATTPALEVRGVWKSFPGVQALRGVSVACYPGEVHGIVGENGAGKSTLMRIVAGIYPADRGTILIDGSVVSVTAPSQARRAGIAMAFQETSLAPDLDIAHNVWLGREASGWLGFVDPALPYSRTAELLDRLGLHVDPATPTHMLSVSQRQLVEVAKALAGARRVLILDEPTAALGPPDVKRLFAILSDLRDRSVSIVFISHRLPEVLAIADRITVLKDGQVTGQAAAREVTERDLVRLMVGRSPEVLYPPRTVRSRDEEVLEVRGLSSGTAFHDVSFAVARGETVGIAGIEGNGQREVVRALFGLVPINTGEIRVSGRSVRLRSPHDAIAAGIAYVTNDRRGEGLALPLSVKENLTVPLLPSLSCGGFIRSGKEVAVANELIERLAIRTPSLDQPVQFLSGGTQQKVSVARWLRTRPRIVIFDEPTVGVDVGAKVELYQMVRELSGEGVGIIILSSDLRELIGLCDRILVVSRGRIVDEQPASTATEESLIASAVTAQGADATRGPARDALLYNGRRVAWLERWSSSLLVATLVAIFVLFTASRSPYFLGETNLASLALQWVPLGLVAFGQTIVLLVAGVDLSVGPLMSLITAEASYLLASTAVSALFLGVAVALATGVCVGLVNGALIRYMKIPDLIATLATFSAVGGAALILRPAPGGQVSESFMAGMTSRIGAVPLVPLLVLAAYGVGEVVLSRSRYGVYVYATGSRAEAAFVSGVPVEHVRFLAYVISGLAGALAGLFLAARIGSGDPQAGASYTLYSVTAAAVGGTSLFGGRGTLTGALLGALLIAGMQNFLDLLGVSSYFQYVWTGVLTLLAVALYSLPFSAWGGRPGVIERVRHAAASLISSRG